MALKSTIHKIQRTLSVFNHSARVWEPISPASPSSLGDTPAKASRRLSLISWNIDGFSPRKISRARLILSHILQRPTPPDIIFLQEVTSDVRASLLDDARVRAGWLATNTDSSGAADQTVSGNVPFETMVLLSRACFSSDDTTTLEDKETQKQGQYAEAKKLHVGRVFRVPLPSKYDRDALCVDINFSATPGTDLGTIVRLVNVHLDSLGHTLQYRIQQMQIVTSLLREPGCSAGLIAGDFNAISPSDHKLIQENELIDAWTSLHGTNDGGGATWGFAARQENSPGPGRLDKIAMVGLRPQEFTILRPGNIEVPRPGEDSIRISWSDHCGLHCTFAL